MRTSKPPALNAREQAERHAERFDAEAAAAARRANAALEEVGTEAARIRQTQELLGIRSFADPSLEIEAALRVGLTRKRTERDYLALRRYLAGTDLKTMPNRRADMQARAEKLRKELGAENSAAPGAPKPGALPAEIERALSILRGGEATQPGDAKVDKQLAQLDEEIIAIESGIYVNAQRVREARSAASYDAAVKLKDAHGKLTLQLYRSAQAFVRMAEEERLLRVAFTSAGFSRSDILPMPIVTGAALVLGSETSWESQIAQARRDLEKRGLL
jgi:hypothetical protein